jgi:hypothetical protein
MRRVGLPCWLGQSEGCTERALWQGSELAVLGHRTPSGLLFL